MLVDYLEETSNDYVVVMFRERLDLYCCFLDVSSMKYRIAGLIDGRLSKLVSGRKVLSMHADRLLNRADKSRLSRHEKHYENYTLISGQIVVSDDRTSCIFVWRSLIDQDSKSMPVLELRRLKFVI